MYDVNVFVYGPEGEDLSFSRICNKEELNELLKCYDKNDLNVKEIPNARLSESMETCFCPYCMRMEFIKEGNVIHICKECGRKYFINNDNYKFVISEDDRIACFKALKTANQLHKYLSEILDKYDIRLKELGYD